MVAVERRKDPKQWLTITQILDLMQRNADEQYNGDLPNNALAIFNQLNTGDKKTYLRKSLLLLWEEQITLAQSGMMDIKIDQETVIDPIAVQKEKKSIEELNIEEQIKLKTWMHKFIFTIGILCFIAFIGITFVVGGDSKSPSTILEHLNNILKLLF